jgi:citrate synthase
MDAMRSLASALAQLDPQADLLSQAEAERIGMRMLGKLPVLIAAWDRRRRGLAPVAADPELSHAANILLMLRGEYPQPAEVRALDTYLVLLAEHGLNASTFAARVAISAQSDVYAAMVAAIATLKGLLHGGANQKAMEAFLAIGSPDRAAAMIDAMLVRHERLMGIGHRIYKVEDPRVRHLRIQVQSLTEQPQANWYRVADAVGAVVAQHPYFVARHLNPNVEFYSAPLLYDLGIPLDLFTAVFALSRTAGWLAHIREQIAENRIIRPKSAYSGPPMRSMLAAGVLVE